MLGLAAAAAGARAQAPKPPPVGELKALGDDRFQIGRIVLDKRARRFSVPGRVLNLGKPLEYLVASPGGGKSYETLLEVDASGSEFNLACILLGLERDPKHAQAREWVDMKPLPGPRVAIRVAWTDAGKRRELSAAEAVLNPDAGIKHETVEWVYIGSPAPDLHGGFAADTRGTLVGFKPDDNNVIESALGIGIGAYGTVVGNPMLPPMGSPIELIVEAAKVAR